MHYHVQVFVHRGEIPEVQLDVSETELEVRFKRPHLLGHTILINGRTITSEQRERVKVTASEDPGSVLLDLVRRQDSVGGLPIHASAKLFAKAADRGTDITNEVFDTPIPVAARNTVFLVKGRWSEACEAMERFLGALGLDVIDWSRARLGPPREGLYNAEVLDAGFGMAFATVVFMTPDDVVSLHPDISGKWIDYHGQPRPNVLFEAGYAWNTMRDRTLLVEYGELRGLSDLSGVDRVRFDGSDRSRIEVADRLERINVDVRRVGDGWLRAGGFPRPLRGLEPPQVTPLAGIPLHFVLLDRLNGCREVGIGEVAAATGAPQSDVRKALAWLLSRGYAKATDGMTREHAVKTGSCELTGEGVTYRDEQMRAWQS